jgi:hypothetical protein
MGFGLKIKTDDDQIVFDRDFDTLEERSCFLRGCSDQNCWPDWEDITDLIHPMSSASRMMMLSALADRIFYPSDGRGHPDLALHTKHPIAILSGSNVHEVIQLISAEVAAAGNVGNARDFNTSQDISAFELHLIGFDSDDECGAYFEGHVFAFENNMDDLTLEFSFPGMELAEPG